MRIDAYNQVSQVYQSSKTKSISGKEKKSFSDTLEISRSGRDLQTAKDAVKAAPDVREDRISDIRQRLADGTYQVSAKDVADKLVDTYFGSMI